MRPRGAVRLLLQARLSLCSPVPRRVAMARDKQREHNCSSYRSALFNGHALFALRLSWRTGLQ